MSNVFSPSGGRARATHDAIATLVARELPSRRLLDEALLSLRRVVPFDAGEWWTTDPESFLPAELWNFDVETINRELLPETGVRLEGSPRHPGAQRDLRVVARAGENVLGAACLTRAVDEDPFSEQELAFSRTIAREVGAGLRKNLLRTASTALDPGRAESGGRLVLGDGDVIEGFTSEAAGWLEKLGVARLDEPLPPALRWVSLQARARVTPAGPASRLRPARSRFVTGAGELVSVTAEVLLGGNGSQVVMSLEPVTPQSLFPLLADLHGLSAREKTVAALVVAGWPLEGIASHLSLSLHTVRDHVKSTYAKVGVSSRPELTARLGGTAAAARLAAS